MAAFILIGVGFGLLQLSVLMARRIDKGSESLPGYDDRYSPEGADFMMEPLFFMLCGMWAVCVTLFAPLFFRRWPGWGRLLVAFGIGVAAIGTFCVIGTLGDWWRVVRA